MVEYFFVDVSAAWSSGEIGREIFKVVAHTDSDMMMWGKIKIREFADIRQGFPAQDSYTTMTTVVLWNTEFMIGTHWWSDTPCMELFMSRDE